MGVHYLGGYLILLGTGHYWEDCEYCYLIYDLIFSPLGEFSSDILMNSIFDLLQRSSRHINAGTHSFNHIWVEKFNRPVSTLLSNNSCITICLHIWEARRLKKFSLCIFIFRRITDLNGSTSRIPDLRDMNNMETLWVDYANMRCTYKMNVTNVCA